MRSYFLAAYLLLSAAILASCFEDDAYFETGDAEGVYVEAYLLRAGDSAKAKVKADTLFPTDSVIFFAVVEPSRSIRITDFSWQIDSGDTYAEFTHRDLVSEAGRHVIRFRLLDRFADTLADSVELWIAPSPELDTSAIIPRSGSRRVSSGSPLSFAWSATVKNPLATTRFPFLLRCSGDTLADTTLSSAQYTYSGEIPALRKCNWRVFATDDFGRISTDSIVATFFSAAGDGDTVLSGSAAATISLSADILAGTEFSLFDSLGSAIPESAFEADLNGTEFSIRNLEAGRYALLFKNGDYPDFKSDSVPFRISPGEVTDLGEIPIADSSAAVIRCPACTGDSLEWADTLVFLVIEGGLPIASSGIQATFDGSTFRDWNFKGDSLRVFTAAVEASFLRHPLSISIRDRAGNSTEASFSVSPGKTCVQALDSASVHVDSAVVIPIKNRCAELVPKRFFWDIDEDGSWDGEAPANGSDSVSKTFSGSLFLGGNRTVQVSILYESGIVLKSRFPLVVTGLSE